MSEGSTSATRLYARILGQLAADFSGVKQEYRFMHDATYASLWRSDVPAAMRVYWSEILNRAHFVAVSALLRQHRWLDAMEKLQAVPNYLGWAACARALIEASGDSLDALERVAMTLADNAVEIQSALDGTLRDRVQNEELENTLIHFEYGRKLAKNEHAPATHVAKSAAAYLAQLKGSTTIAVQELYGLLCQVTHPASGSVVCFSESLTANLDQLNCTRDAEHIRLVSEKYGAEFVHALVHGANPPLLILKTLREFNRTGLNTDPVATIDLSAIPAWQKIEARFRT